MIPIDLLEYLPATLRSCQASRNLQVMPDSTMDSVPCDSSHGFDFRVLYRTLASGKVKHTVHPLPSSDSIQMRPP
jgi:hypothetical protein